MTQLDEHIEEVEQYGFVRRNFPIRFNGHTIQILSNDATIDNGRLMFSFCLHCKDCDMMDRISGRFPAHFDDQTEHIVNAKIAVFSKFEARDCKLNPPNA